MKTHRECSKKTCRKLLAAAVDVFAEKGYRDATIADISSRAKVNIAAVNYHFGDKETLYREAWRYAFSESIKAHPPDAGVSDDSPPEGRLRGQIIALLHRISDKKNKEFFIVMKEFANPTGLLNEIMQETLLPLQKSMQDTIRELIGPQAQDMQIQFCEISIISQCINPAVIRSNQKEMIGPSEIIDIEKYADHVVQFSLAGIHKVQAESGKKTFLRRTKVARPLKGKL
ncbi:MAG: CerR family C-terminal domain-containing protein [Nitrospirae bacterium]|nr:CerR family C-terminal domain-containing protein [Nitrospirota bacterium]